MSNSPGVTPARFATHYDDVAKFRAEAFTATPIGRGEHLQAMIVCFEPGQFIPAHAPRLDLALVILEGEGELAIENRTETIKPGSVAFIPGGSTRGVRAFTKIKAFQVVSPPPTPGDHDGVQEGLKRGAWR